MKFRSDVAGTRHRRSASTRARRTPARTSGTCGRAPGTLLAHGDVHRRDRRPAGSRRRFSTPVAITAEHDVRGVVLRAGRRLRESTLDYFATPRSTRPPLHALRDGDGRRQRRLPLRAERRVPDQASTAPRTTGSTSSFQTAAGAPDTTPPTVDRRDARPRGATGVARAPNVTATFSEPMNPATSTATAITLRNAAGTASPAAVTYDAGEPDRDARPDRRAGRQHDLHGASRGRRVAASRTSPATRWRRRHWTFTTAAPSSSGCPCTIWPSTARPQHSESADDRKAVELGTKFRADVDGIDHRRSGSTRARQHRHPRRPPVDAHRARCWPPRRSRRDGDRLAAGHLRRRRSRSPPNTTYVASYFAPVGGYAVDDRHSSPPASTRRRCTRCATATTAPTASTATAPSGRSRRGTYRSENYWVDVVFDDERRRRTSRRPTVTGRAARRPAPRACRGRRTSRATFSEADGRASTIAASTFRLRDPGGAVVPAAVSYDAGDPDGDARSERRPRRP